MSMAEIPRFQLWTEAELTDHQMLARVAEDLDAIEARVDAGFIELKSDVRRMSAWLSAAALSFMGATVAFVFNLVR